jgi:hypothetical protein
MEFDPQVQSRWKIALVSGGISACILFSRFALEQLGFLVIPISVVGSLVGLLLGVLSILAKEKKWFLAIPAIVLSLVCPYHIAMSFYEAHTEVTARSADPAVTANVPDGTWLS